jgi:hypothetical protein
MNARMRVVVTLILAGATSCSHWDSGVSPSEVQVGDGKPVSFFPAPPFPELTKPGAVYNELNPVQEAGPVQVASRYVLYDDGTFELQMSDIQKLFVLSGRYTRVDSLITFQDFSAWSAAGPYTASAILRGEELVVSYGLVMQMTDYSDATYVRADGW